MRWLLSLCVASCVCADEQIGDLVVRAPDSAEVGEIMGANHGWLHVQNSPVTPEEAFSGEGILDDGWANWAWDVSAVVTFNDPVVNNAGPDLVMYDARFDDGGYAIAVDFDDFTAEHLLGNDDFTWTGETRDYWYEVFNDKTYEAEIWQGLIDLSDLGVPLGASVSSVRFRSFDGGPDPIGMGAIVPAPAASLLLAPLLMRRRRA